MKTLILAAFTALTLGLSVGNAATTNNHAPVQQGGYNFMEGGGG
jgi:hypothetical protein